MSTRHDDSQVYWIIGVAVAVFFMWMRRAEAATVQLTCTAPTQHTNGTPITAALTYTAYWGTSATSLTNTSALAGPGCKGPVVVPDPAPGTSITYYFAVTAIAGVMESAKSNVAAKTYATPLPTPNPPMLLTIERIGYQLNLGSNNRIYFSRVGALDLGKECQVGMEVMGKSVIKSRDWLALDAGKTRPRQVFALCQRT